MDSQRTSHILLVIIAVGIFFMIYLFMKERYFRDPGVQPIVWGETVPAQSSVTPTAKPNVPLSGKTNTFVKGNSYSLDLRTENLAGIKHTYCYETQYQWIFTDEMGQEDPCVGIEDRNKNIVSKINMEVRLKDTTTPAMLAALNAQYDVSDLPSTNSDGFLVFEIPYHVGYGYNSYTLAQKYFDTGYFDIVRPTMTIGMGEEY